MKIAIITGASAGIGRALVYAIDKAGSYDRIWVIARRRERLAGHLGPLPSATLPDRKIPYA